MWLEDLAVQSWSPERARSSRNHVTGGGSSVAGLLPAGFVFISPAPGYVPLDKLLKPL